MKVSWYSAGVSSFIATYLERESIDEILYIHINDQHLDTLRFKADCEKGIGKEFTTLQSRYKTVAEVIQQFQYVNSPYGATCTNVLKKRVRKEWEKGKTDITYVWGFDYTEKHRADRLLETMPQFKHVFPLIDRQLTKEDCHGMLWKLGIERPQMYNLGYKNNNCIGCLKGGKGYWNKIRIDFPEVFADRAKQERVIGHTCIKGVYLDELDPNCGRMEEEVMEECGILCQLNV